MTSRSVPRYLIAPLILVLAIYAWYFTAGYWTHLPDVFSWDLYDRLASAFAAGQLYLEEAPAPDLLALSDPYSIQARRNVSSYIGDATLYEGRYYLYWGPVPAVLIAMAKVIGIETRIGDAVLVMLSVSGVFLILAALLARLWNDLFSDLPRWTLVAALPVVAFAPPLTWMLNNPLIYEAALASAEFFFVTGLLAGYFALSLPAKPEGWFLLAGTSWALAIGCQFTQTIAVGAAAALLILWSVAAPRSSGGHRRAIAAVAVCAPIVLMLLALGWYNFARFGSPWEFGYRYQLAVINLHEHYGDIFRAIFAIPNIYNYLLNPFQVSSTFPFLLPKYGSVPQGIGLPTLYYSEAITGLLYSAPILIFATVPAVLWCRRTAPGQQRVLMPPRLQDPLHRLVCAIGAALVPNLGVLLFFYYSAPRYLMAVMPLLLVLSVLGFWLSYRNLAARPGWQRAVVAIAASLAACTVVVSLLLAVSSSQDRFVQANPELIHSINRMLFDK